MSLRDKFSDIPYSQKTEKENYTNSFDIENETIDFNILSDYEDSEQVMNAHSLSKVEERVDAMQSVIGDEIIDNLDDKQQLFQDWIDNLADTAKPWQSGAEHKYYKNDVVYTNNNGIFICLQDCDGNRVPPFPATNKNGYVNAANNKIEIIVSGEIIFNIYYKYQLENGDLEPHMLSFKVKISSNEWEVLDGNIEDFIASDSCIITSYMGENGTYFYVTLTLYEDEPRINYYLSIMPYNYSGHDEIIASYDIMIIENKTNYWLWLYTKGEQGESVYNLNYKGAYLYNATDLRSHNFFDIFSRVSVDVKIPEQFTHKYINFVYYPEAHDMSEIARSYDIYFGTPSEFYSEELDTYYNYDGEYNVTVQYNGHGDYIMQDVVCGIGSSSSMSDNDNMNFIYQINDIVFIDNGTDEIFEADNDNVDFYVCINDNVEVNIDIHPAEDPTNWIKLFSVPRDKIKIYDEMPNQEFFDDPKSSSIFGVTQLAPMNEVIDIRNDKYVIDDFDAFARYKIEYYEDASQDSHEIIIPSFWSTYETLTDIISTVNNERNVFSCNIDYIDSIRDTLGNYNIQVNFDVLGSEIQGSKIISKWVPSNGYLIDESYGLPFTIIYSIMKYEGKNLLFVQFDEVATDDVSVAISVNLGEAKAFNIDRYSEGNEFASLVLLEKASKAVIIKGHTATHEINTNTIYIKQIIDEFHSWDNYGSSTLPKPKIVFADKINSIKFIDRIGSESAENPTMIAPRQTVQYIYNEDGVPLNTQIENLLVSQNLWGIRSNFGLT